MAREKPLDSEVLQVWLASWDESELFSDPAVHHLKSLIADTHCYVVVTMGVGREPRSLVFRRRKYVLPAALGQPSNPIIFPSPRDGAAPPPATAATPGNAPMPAHLNRALAGDIRVPSRFVRRDISRNAGRFMGWDIKRIPSLFAGPVAPAAPPIGQLWHQTGVKLEKILRWDGADWVIAGHVIDTPNVSVQGKQRCDFMEALAYARGLAQWLDCEFIYTYDGSTWGNA